MVDSDGGGSVVKLTLLVAVKAIPTGSEPTQGEAAGVDDEVVEFFRIVVVTTQGGAHDPGLFRLRPLVVVLFLVPLRPQAEVIDLESASVSPREVDSFACRSSTSRDAPKRSVLRYAST